MVMFESFLIFDQKFSKQCDGVVMGSPLGCKRHEWEMGDKL